MRHIFGEHICLLLFISTLSVTDAFSKNPTAKINFIDGSQIVLFNFMLDSKSTISANIGDSKTEVDFGVLKSLIITIQKKYPNNCMLILTSNVDSTQLEIERSNSYTISGEVQAGNLYYSFETRLGLCKSITFLGIDSNTDNDKSLYENYPISCNVVTTKGKLLELTDFVLYGIGKTDTGYSYSFNVMARNAVEKEIFAKVNTFNFIVSNGTVQLSTTEINSIDFNNGYIVLVNQEQVKFLVAKEIEKSSFYDRRLRAVAEWFNKTYCVVDIADIREINNILIMSNSNNNKVTAEEMIPLKRISIKDTNGKTQILENATIVGIDDVLDFSRILTDELIPAFHLDDSKTSIITYPRSLNFLAVKFEGYWQSIPIKRISKYKRNKDIIELSLWDGSVIKCNEIDVHRISGKGSWGDVSINFQKVVSFDILEHGQ